MSRRSAQAALRRVALCTRDGAHRTWPRAAARLPPVIRELEVLRSLLPGPDEIWLAVVFGSGARDTLGPRSDIDVLVEGVGEATDIWQHRSQEAVRREVSLYSVRHMLRQPLIVCEILEEHVVLRDARGRLDEMREALEADDRLAGFELRILREVLGDFNADAPGLAYTPSDRRFIDALASVRNEAKKLRDPRVSALERQWSTERMTRWIRNLLRDWPEHGDARNPVATIEQLTHALDPATVAALRELPYDGARADPVEVRLDPGWADAEALLVPVLDNILDAATRALRKSRSIGA